MLIEHVERYLNLRGTLGYKLREARRELMAFANLSEARGEKFVTLQTASQWADAAPSAYSRSSRMRKIILFAKFMHAEDDRHEVPSFENYRHIYVRPLPYIYSRVEITRLLDATAKLKKQRPERREMYRVFFGLMVVTGLRVSEALNLRITDIEANGVLRIRSTKFGKSRLVPLHATALIEIDRYLAVRRRWACDHDYLFTARSGARLSHRTLHYTFYTLLKIASIAPARKPRPRIHDVRHTFATRALEQCPTDRKSVAQHFVALSTYLGHADIKATYWYLEATPALMQEMATVTETFAGRQS